MNKKLELYKSAISATVALLLCGGFNTKAQDVHFSQFYMAPLFMNPALAGAQHDIEAILNYKNQWQSVSAPFRTYAASYDMRITKSHGKKGFWAVGINAFSDDDGTAAVTTTQANLTVAYQVVVSQYSVIGAGIQGGYAQRSINPSSFQWGDQYDGMAYNGSLPSNEPVMSNSLGYADLGAGINWSYDNTAGSINVTDNHDLKADAGFAMYHLTQPKYSFYGDNEKLYIRYVLHGSVLFCLPNSNIGFVPGVFYAMQGPAYELYAGTLIRYKLKQDSKYTGIYKNAALYLGGYYRMADAGVISFMLEYSKFSVGISYDINTSGLNTASYGKGGLELSLRFVNPDPFSTGEIPDKDKSMF
jgi:type IX secretion system PorP/SprF family membrane protein